MSDLISVIRAIVRDEVSALRFGDIAVVTSIFPHKEGDKNNYECSVKLRDSDLELRRVPMTTPHAGMVSTPQVDDLVLVSYIGADPNKPIVVGRLYSDTVNPPEHAEKEWHMVAPYGGETSLSIDEKESIVLQSGKTMVTIKKDGSLEIAGEEDLKLEVKGNVELKCADCKIDASGNIELGSGGGAVITDKSHKCYFTGAPLVGSGTVTAKG